MRWSRTRTSSYGSTSSTKKVGRQTVTDKADLTAKIMRSLRNLQKLPALVGSFLQAPAVAYAAL